MAEHPTPTPARKPTQEEVESNRQWAFMADADLKGALRQVRVDLWEVAKRLHEWDERQGWAWTGNYDTLGEWLADPDVTMTRGTYYRLRDSYRCLVIEEHIDEAAVRELETSKVGVVIKAIRAHDVDVNEAISDVEVLPVRDLREKYYPRPEASTVGQDADNGSEPPVLDADALSEDGPSGIAEEPSEASESSIGDDGQADDEAVLIPRWLASAIVEKFGANRRMSQEWIDVLKGALA
jgi:hypothetical protein